MGLQSSLCKTKTKMNVSFSFSFRVVKIPLGPAVWLSLAAGLSQATAPSNWNLNIFFLNIVTHWCISLKMFSIFRLKNVFPMFWPNIFSPSGAVGGKRYHVQGQFLVWLMLKLRWVQLFLPSRLIRPHYISTNPQYWQICLSFFKLIVTLRRFFSKTTGLQRLVLGSLERGRSPLSFWRLGGAFLSRENHVRGLRPLKPPFF